ncbi:MAG: alanine racemase [Candidatus Muiribacteriaceae bacterium]
MNPTRAYVNLNILRKNLENIREHTGRKILVAVKANAYGHGAVRVSSFIEKHSLAEYLGVATVSEGVELRKAGISLPILKFSECMPYEIDDLIKYNIECAVYSADFIRHLSNRLERSSGNIPVHLKIDTGMGRVGVPYKDLDSIISILSDSALNIKGVMTHFPESDSRDKGFTEKQIQIFSECVDRIRESGISPEIIHTANSGAVIDHPDSWFDMVRPGIMCYGYYPSNETSETVKIQPVLSLVTKISYLKETGADFSVSYGCTYRTFEKTHIATIPVGYGDGYSRLFSNRAITGIHGRQYRIAGRVCMDQCMIDIGQNDSDIKPGDDVVLYGKYGEDDISLDYLCSLIPTIPYEPLCNIAPRVPRIYIEEE